jgi:triphosphoribosyl-dephospho-CoA synthase
VNAPLPDDVSAALQLACLLEASAPKPGNVSPGHPFADTTYEDFLASAAAVGPAFALAGTVPLGETILEAVRATRRWTPRNTNLGIILLLAPLARAAMQPGGAPLRTRLAGVLASTTVHDAALTYEAIALAAPGGLGSTPEQDVHAAPTISLLETMRLAQGWDTIAAEYANDFAVTFEIGAPTLRRARAAGLTWNDAIVECALALLAAVPDALIARKLGAEHAARVSDRAAEVVRLGGTGRDAGRQALAQLDQWLRADGNRRNPGTTADLTAAGLGVLLLERFDDHPQENEG